MKDVLAAKRYAKAMLETFGGDRLDAFSSEFFALAAALSESRELASVLKNPVFSDGDKQGVLDALLEKAGASDGVASSFRVILGNNRFDALPAISAEFEALALDALGKVKVEVTTAVPLSDSEKDELGQKLSAMTGKEAVMTVTEDPALIGGVVARIGSKVYDGSVVNQLKGLRVGL